MDSTHEGTIEDCWEAASNLNGRSVEELKASGCRIAKVCLVEVED